MHWNLRHISWQVVLATLWRCVPRARSEFGVVQSRRSSCWLLCCMLQIACYGSGLWGYSDCLLYCNLGWRHGSREIKRRNCFATYIVIWSEKLVLAVLLRDENRDNVGTWRGDFVLGLRRNNTAATMGELDKMCVTWSASVLWQGRISHMRWLGEWNVRTYSVSDLVRFLTSSWRRRYPAVWQDRQCTYDLTFLNHMSLWTMQKMLIVAQEMILWRIYVAINNKVPLGLDVRCPIFLSDFKNVWLSSTIRYFGNLRVSSE